MICHTQTQYIFIHDALSEFIMYGQTEIAATDIRKVINELNLQHDPCSASTGFEHQFQVCILSELLCYVLFNNNITKGPRSG